MKQPRAYREKTNGELLRFYQKMLREVDDCKTLAQNIGNGSAAAEHFLRGAKGAQEECQRIKAELDHRGLII